MGSHQGREAYYALSTERLARQRARIKRKHDSIKKDVILAVIGFILIWALVSL